MNASIKPQEINEKRPEVIDAAPPLDTCILNALTLAGVFKSDDVAAQRLDAMRDKVELKYPAHLRSDAVLGKKGHSWNVRCARYRARPPARVARALRPLPRAAVGHHSRCGG